MKRRENSRSVRGGVTATGGFRWTGHESDIEVFVQDEITGLLKGRPTLSLAPYSV